MAPRVNVRFDQLDTSRLHAGLWFDRYYPGSTQLDQEKAAKQKAQFVQDTSRIPQPEDYLAYYQRWVQLLGDLDAKRQEATVRTRMIVGLGDEGVIETAITLHHTYGVPYIPGSALKGLTAAYARKWLGEAWIATTTNYTTVFGTTDEAGFVTFFDALYVPKSGTNGQALHPDVMTTHHPTYYVNTTPTPPADWDSPTPVPFLTATGRYLIALAGPEDWVNVAFHILSLALRDEGIGAKTSSGYGRMVFIDSATGSTTASVTPTSSAAQPAPEAPTKQPPPAPAERALPTSFTGTVLERDEEVILIAVPGFDPAKVVGMLTIAPDTPNWQRGNSARVEVIGQRTNKRGLIILELKRVPKKS